MSAAYAWEKLYLAVRALATENQPLRGRLYDVYWHNLLILKTHPIPWGDLRQKFEDICHELAPPGADPKKVLAAWPDEDVSRIAGQVVDLFVAISRRHPG